MPVTLREEVEKYARSKGILDISNVREDGRLVVGFYLSGNAELFALALADADFCAFGVPKEKREKLNPPKQRKDIYRSVEHTVKECGRHLSEELSEEFFGLVGKLKKGEAVPAEKARLIAGVIRNYLDDYLSAHTAWHSGYGIPAC